MPTMTYAEIAAALGIAPASAYRLALRRRWPRAKGNDGKTKVSVPDEALARHSDSTTDRHPDSPTVSQDDSHLTIARLEGELKGVREALVDTRAHVETLKAQLAAADARAGEEAAKTAQAIAAFESLAQRLEAIAEARRPWWRRLVG